MDAVIILGNINEIDKSLLVDKLVVGVDKGAYLAYKNGITLDIAIGDFDSVNQYEFECIKKISKRVITLNSVKDKTDTKEAIQLCNDCQKILILGGIKGKRIEHFIANTIEAINDPRIELIDDNSFICTKDTSFTPNDKYKYISFFAISQNTKISIKGFKYELENYDLSMNDPLCISNEISNNPVVNIDGRVLVIYSKDDNENI